MEAFRLFTLVILLPLSTHIHADIIVQPGYTQPQELYSNFKYRDAVEPNNGVQVIHHYIQESELNQPIGELSLRNSPIRAPHYPLPVGLATRPHLHYAKLGGVGNIRPSTTFVTSSYSPDAVHYRYRRSLLEENRSDSGLTNDVAEKSSIDESLSDVDSQEAKIRSPRNNEEKSIGIRQSKNDHAIVGSSLMNLNSNNFYPGYHQIQPNDNMNLVSNMKPEARSSSNQIQSFQPWFSQNSLDEDAMKPEAKSNSAPQAQSYQLPTWLRQSLTSKPIDDASKKASDLFQDMSTVTHASASPKLAEEMNKKSSETDSNRPAWVQIVSSPQVTHIDQNDLGEKEQEAKKPIINQQETKKEVQGQSENPINSSITLIDHNKLEDTPRSNEKHTTIYVSEEPQSEFYRDSNSAWQMVLPNYYASPVSYYTRPMYSPLARNYPDPRPIDHTHSSDVVTIHHDGSSQDASKIMPHSGTRDNLYARLSMLTGLGNPTDSLDSIIYGMAAPTYNSYYPTTPYNTYSYSYEPTEEPTYIMYDDIDYNNNIEMPNERTVKVLGTHHHGLQISNSKYPIGSYSYSQPSYSSNHDSSSVFTSAGSSASATSATLSTPNYPFKYYYNGFSPYSHKNSVYSPYASY